MDEFRFEPTPDLLAAEPEAGADLDAEAGLSAFARSELFDRTFREGMELVEHAAAYLDGEGRRDSKLLSRDAALAYAGESMRLTTRLMQVASWLLVQRAVRQGEMSARDAREPRYRLDAPPDDAAAPRTEAEALPPQMRELAAHSARLFERVRQLDLRLNAPGAAPDAVSPVRAQQARLRSAFGA